MPYQEPRPQALTYETCRYGTARLSFRGPAKQLLGPYGLCLGSTETYGKYVARPYPTMVEAELGLPMANLGVLNAGVDVYLAEPELLAAANRACGVVVQIAGAHSLSNRYYAVHPRRNDRFLRPTERLRTLYPKLDFTDFTFVGHLLRALHAAEPEVFGIIVEELCDTWIRRMTLLLKSIEAPTVLLWIGRAPPPEVCDRTPRIRQAAGPLFVDRGMVRAVAPLADRYVESVASQEARAAGTEGMAFDQRDGLAATVLPGPRVHAEVAGRLSPVLQDMLH